jgi:hypothetical protein
MGSTFRRAEIVAKECSNYSIDALNRSTNGHLYSINKHQKDKLVINNNNNITVFFFFDENNITVLC